MALPIRPIDFRDTNDNVYSSRLLNGPETLPTNGLKEVSMLEDIKFDLQTLDFRALTPTQWSALKAQLIEQARQNRNAELRKATALRFDWPERVLSAVSRAFIRRMRAFVISRWRRAAFTALSALDDRALHDIGLRRGEIFSAVYRPQSGRRR